MVDLPLSFLLTLSSATALIFHISTIRVELDYKLWNLGGVYLCVYGLLVYAFSLDSNLTAGALKALLLSICFNATLTISILTHRIFFHRLRHFPGPFGAKVSRFWHIFKLWDSQAGHLLSQEMHKHGDIVRYGPCELSINLVDAIPAIYGPTSLCTKSLFYNIVGPEENHSIFHVRNKQFHKERRRAWDKAFNGVNLAIYQPKIERCISVLLQELRTCDVTSDGINITLWASFLAFDVMGETGFGRSYNMLETGSLHPAVKCQKDSLPMYGIGTKIPWFVRLMMILPPSYSPIKPIMKWCGNEMEEKIKKFNQGEKPTDIASVLLCDEQCGLGKLKIEATHDDARLVIGAGSETTGMTLTGVLFYLATNRRVFTKLRNILDERFPGGESQYQYSPSLDIPYLDAIINETLRLQPSVISGLPRLTPPEGVTINGTYIPGNVVVQVPTYTIQRDPRYFSQPLDFIPERWTDESPELCKDKRAFMPFGLGSHVCAGKAFGIMEIRIAIARICLSFDWELAEGQTEKAYFEGQRDFFTCCLPNLFLRFTPWERG
ncbi:cytochrome P450 [Trichophaea hybrida]|nr:cytochrome P450 [Trichophaea hybrida]